MSEKQPYPAQPPSYFNAGAASYPPTVNNSAPPIVVQQPMIVTGMTRLGSSPQHLSIFKKL